MRRSLHAAAALVAALLLADARADDEWLGGDKRAHFLGGAIVGGITSEHTGSRGPGVFGELIEAARYGWHGKHASARDFAAGCLGAVSGALIAVQVAPGRIRWSMKF